MRESQAQKILIIYAHPNQAGSTANKALIKAVSTLVHVTIVDLYAQYPDFKIDIKAQQKLLAETDILIFQFPLYWYSSPALLKEWQDVVLEHGVNYGSNINMLTGKKFFCAVSAGVSAHELSVKGDAGHSLTTILCPFECTFKFCNMQILSHFLWYDASDNSANHAQKYSNLLTALRAPKPIHSSSPLNQDSNI